jgi:hypothetical protein
VRAGAVCNMEGSFCCSEEGSSFEGFSFSCLSSSWSFLLTLLSFASQVRQLAPKGRRVGMGSDRRSYQDCRGLPQP